jgi:hypothetical protein
MAKGSTAVAPEPRSAMLRETAVYQLKSRITRITLLTNWFAVTRVSWRSCEYVCTVLDWLPTYIYTWVCRKFIFKFVDAQKASVGFFSLNTAWQSWCRLVIVLEQPKIGLIIISPHCQKWGFGHEGRLCAEYNPFSANWKAERHLPRLRLWIYAILHCYSVCSEKVVVLFSCHGDRRPRFRRYRGDGEELTAKQLVKKARTAGLS